LETRVIERDSWDRKTWTGQLRQDSWDRTATEEVGIIQPGQDREDRAART